MPKDKDATVTGNVNLKFANSVTDNAIYGGGEVGYPNKKSAAVTGKVSIDLSALNNGFGRPDLWRWMWRDSSSGRSCDYCPKY